MSLNKKLIVLIIMFYIFQYLFSSFVIANDEIINNLEENNEELKIYSESAILIEEKTGKILYEKNMHDKKYPASTTKILTAIIAIENCDLSDTATASYEAVNSIEKGYTKADIKVGETFTIEQLLSVLMLQSANEAANIIAEHISGSVSEFAKLMNKKAKEIGCVDSNFVNANGAHNENHYSSAYDLSIIARYSMKNETFRRIVTQSECSLPHTEFWTDEDVEEHGERNFKNTNSLLKPDSQYYYPYAISIKAGFTTPAKNCLVTGSNKDGFETIAVVLHGENTEEGLSARYVDTINLFNYGYDNYNLEEILSEYDDTYLVSIQTENQESKQTKKEILEQNINNDNIFKEMLKIIIGFSILLVIIIYYFIKINNKIKNITKRLYYFNINE